MNDNEDINNDIYFEKPKLERHVATNFDLAPPKINVPEPPKGTKHFWNDFEPPIKQGNRFKINLISDSQVSNWYNSLNFHEKKKWLQYFISNLSENDLESNIIDNKLRIGISEPSGEYINSKFKVNDID